MRILLFKLNFVLKSLLPFPTRKSPLDYEEDIQKQISSGSTNYVTCVGGFSSVAFSWQKVREVISKYLLPIIHTTLQLLCQNFAHVNHTAGYTGYYKISMLFYLHRPPHPL